jgi:hypothetical protein
VPSTPVLIVYSALTQSMAQILRFLLMERLLIASYNLGFSHMELVRRQEGVDISHSLQLDLLTKTFKSSGWQQVARADVGDSLCAATCGSKCS